MLHLDCESLREQLALYPGCQPGFVIFRYTYKDDSQWVRFIDHLNRRTRWILDYTGNGGFFQHVELERP
ncbi:hypothetical protein PSPO01_05559 [Paraphaeosphaeria sporulosa]